MLTSEYQEQSRRFALALRVGIPVLILVGLIVYIVILRNDTDFKSTENIFLILSTIFVTIYFIYFLMTLETQESLLDPLSKSYNESTLHKKIYSYKPQAMGIFAIEDMQTLYEALGADKISEAIYSTTLQLEATLKANGEKTPLIGRCYSGEWIIGSNYLSAKQLRDILEEVAANSLNIAYQFATLKTKDVQYKNVTLHLKDLIQNFSKETQENNSLNANELNKLEQESIIAVQEHNLVFSFRPLLNLNTNMVDIYEVFIKLKTYDDEELAPKQYLPIINRLGLTRQYDLSIISNILNMASSVNKNISFSCNLSPFSLRDEVFKKHFFSLIEASQIEPNRLIIQLYERKTHHNLSSYLETLQAIRDRGIRICIDNFGSSNASIEYMKHFHFDMVQFDRDYVVHLDEEQRQTLFKSLIEMSKQLNITTVAKWVDNPSQNEKLKLLGINYAQGFAIGGSITYEELLELQKTNQRNTQ